MIHRNTYVNAPSHAGADLRDAPPAGPLLRGPDVGGRGVRGVRGLGPAGRARGRRPRAGREPDRLPGGHRARRARPVYRPQRPRELSAHQHRLRPPARAAAADPGQGATTAGHVRPGARISLDAFRPLGRGRRAASGGEPPERERRETAIAGLPAPPRPGAQRLRPHGPGLRATTSTSSRPTSRRSSGASRASSDVDHLADPRPSWPACTAQGVKKVSAARKLASLRTFFRYLCREGVLERNPARALLSPRLERRIPAHLDEGEVAALLDVPGETTAAPARPGHPGAALRAPGIRCAELVGLDLGGRRSGRADGPSAGQRQQRADRALRAAGRPRSRRLSCPRGSTPGPGRRPSS